MNFKRTFIITEDYKKKMQADAHVTSGTAANYLLGHSLLLSNYLDDWRRLKKELNVLNKEFTDFKKDKWAYYRFKYDYQTSTTDADRLLPLDKDVAEFQNMVDEIELDIDFIKTYMDALRSKSYNIKNWLEIRKFENGEG